MVPTTPGLFLGLFGVVILMRIIALPTVAGTNEVAEMQLNFWREKLPSVQVPETVTAICTMETAFAPHVGEFGPDVLRELDDKNNIFFSHEELREGGQITLPDLSSPWKAFLPRNLSQLMPFATVALSEILSSFGISERSNMAINMNMTLNACEAKPQEGEIKTCTTSIEGMIEFVLSNLGSSHNVELVFHPARTADSGKKARVTKVVERLSGHSNRPPLACHRFVYPYGIFYCHSINGTSTFTMELEVLENNDNFYNSVTALCHPKGQSKESGHCHLFLGDSLLWLIKDY